MILLLLVMALSQPTVSPLQQDVGPYQPFQTVYSVTVPKNVGREDALFVGELEKKSMFFPCIVQNLRVEVADRGDDRDNDRVLTYSFLLLPRSSGSFFFSPGTIPFSGDKPVVCPAIAGRVARPIPVSVFQERLLPLNPDQALTLSEKNRGISFKEIAERERLRSEKLFVKRESLVAALSVFMIGFIAAILLFWIIFELELLHRVKPTRSLYVDWEKELQKLFKSSSLSFSVRFSALAHILPHIMRLSSEELASLLAQLDEMRFASHEIDEQKADKFWKKIESLLSLDFVQSREERN